MTGHLFADSTELTKLRAEEFPTIYRPGLTVLDLIFDVAPQVTVWIGAEDLARVAGMLRHAAESIEAIIEAKYEKEVSALSARQVASAA